MHTVKPAPTQLFCKPDEAEQQTKSGILLSAALDKPKTAKVINIGDTVSGFHPKDTIVYKSYATTELKLNGDDYFLISQDDVLGTVVEVDG